VAISASSISSSSSKRGPPGRTMLVRTIEKSSDPWSKTAMASGDTVVDQLDGKHWLVVEVVDVGVEHRAGGEVVGVSLVVYNACQVDAFKHSGCGIVGV
jgi:hypothetical protein